ncbi:MAG: mannonate dehydratase [Eubacteriales bacterium]
MKMTFRWYGEGDGIPLSHIRQIPGMSGVVTAVYDIPVGEVWPMERIEALRALCKKENLEMEVIESVPVHEDIKLGRPTRDRYIANYAETIRNLGRAGVKCICYNFMPVFDWLRTDLHTPDPDGSNSLSYRHEELTGLDLQDLHLPGWDESYTPSELQSLLAAYEGMTHDRLFENLVYFLNGIMPACNETGINMAIHPDDPPWDMFGLPRIITGIESYRKLFEAVPDRHNGITLCTGSLGAARENDLPAMARELAGRTYFVHLRQILLSGERDFRERGHHSTEGSLDMYAIVKALVDAGFDGYVRPDHGRNIWGEEGKPGYGLYDRALGACYLCGLFEAVERSALKEEKHEITVQN